MMDEGTWEDKVKQKTKDHNYIMMDKVTREDKVEQNKRS
jgi:hypothetical protein